MSEPTTTAPTREARPTAGEGGPCYVYAVGRDLPGLAAAVADVPGLDGARVRTVCAQGLAALVCAVSPDAFSEAGLRGQLGDLERLSVIARSHHDLVLAASALTTVLPLRLGTVYRDAPRVAGMLRENGPALRGLLDRLAGHAEWGVKVYADRGSGAPPARPAGDGDREAGAEGLGRAYLRRRRAERETRRTADRAAREVTARVRAAADAWAADGVAHRPQQGDLVTERGENLANDAYLVAARHTDDFHRAVHEAVAHADGVRVTVTGPWAPYSFATPPGGELEPGLDQEAGRDR
ncbi:GvpL/GvpF family gas vesicle protein [Streptomyces sp. NPDC057702]|uniref:GvpL/GvpF family gas vesicle protein n=1 Tax=unclassified Streptomyces TaxID=2593676 RepID=UPI00367B7815